MTAASVGSFSTERICTGENSLLTTHSFQYLSITGGGVEKNLPIEYEKATVLLLLRLMTSGSDLTSNIE